MAHKMEYNLTILFIVPSQPPQNVTAYAQSSTAIVVFYYPPPSADQNGIITSFRISIKGTPFDTDVDVTSLTVATPVYPLETGASHLITQLHAYNTYSIEITAVNSVGESGLSDTVSITTLQSGIAYLVGNCILLILFTLTFGMGII